MPIKRKTDNLATYRAKRDFGKTAEPSGAKAAKKSKAARFVVQHHWARREHYDFRLEMDGVLKSWAVTRGPSAKPATKRLAVRTEDHPLDYATFEGTIPQGEYGGGTVQLWDQGAFDPLDSEPLKALEKGVLKVRLHGERMKGDWALVRLKPRGGERTENWLLIKDRDAYAEDDDTLAERFPLSVETGRSREEIAAGEKPKPRKGAKAVVKTAAKKAAVKKPAASKAPAKTVARASASRTRKSAAPQFVPPALCEIRASAPEGDEWLHEMKYDGYRLQVVLDHGEARLFTREGHDWTERFPPLREAAEKLPFDSAVLDGEAVVFDRKGISDFPALVAALKGSRRGFGLPVFDLMFENGEDLRKLPLAERKARLQKALARASGPIAYAEHVVGGGPEFFRQAVEGGAEGIVSKRADSPYRSGRTPAWAKVKDRRREDVTIIGWTASDRGRVFASLVVAREEKGRLIYAGRVGTGFDAPRQEELMALLRPLARAAPPDNVERLDLAPRGVRWVEPGLIVEVAMAGWTGDGQVRQGAFLGVREDRASELERARKHAPAKAAAAPQTPAVQADLSRLTNPDRMMYPQVGVTKRQIAEYLVKIAPRMTPHLEGRPVSFVRAPEGVEGERFFQRHPLRGMSRGLATVPISRERRDYLAIESVEGLVTCAQFGVLEIHGWCARREAIEKPDRIVFDLDPDEGLPFDEVKAGAREVRDLLEAAGLTSFPLVSGGKGVHVVVPLAPEREWPEIEAFAEGFARRMAAHNPARWVAVMTKARRTGKIFLDYLRNKRTATAILPWSLRARPNASVAVPVSWRELTRIKSADAFDMAAALKRKSDPWAEFFTLKQRISDETLAVVAARKRRA
ncbi:MAG: ligase [Hyphomicrobiales bacterium]|nr:ligase [Hyphomicrobiales bacterium]